MKREMILPVLLSFGISLALGPVLIPFLRKVKAGQKEREEGVPSHQKKAGTPTMGGVMFLAGPVCAAAMILPAGLVIDGLNDSKKLTDKKRRELYDVITQNAVSYGIAMASEREINPDALLIGFGRRFAE